MCVYIYIYIYIYVCIYILGLGNSVKPNSLHTDKNAVIHRVKILSFSDPYLLVFWLNIEIYYVNPHIQSEYGKSRSRKNSVFGNFSHRKLRIWSNLLKKSFM